MKQLLELVPIALFFIAYQFDGETVTVAGWSHTVDGIFTATGVMIAATVLQILVTWLVWRSLERRLLWTGAAVIVFGGATLLLHDETFIQWKPTVFNWAMGVVFAGSQFIGGRNLVERLMGSQIKLPRRIWARVNWLWVAHFTYVGVLNLVVAYSFTEATWVSYKLYSSIGFTLLLMTLTALIIGPYLRQKPPFSDTELKNP